MAFNQYVRTSVSKNMAEARHRVIDLYRKCLRSIPSLIVQYELDLDPGIMARRIRTDFEQYKDVTDLRIVDKLLFMGVVDLEEARLLWKQTSHVEYYFEKENQFLMNSENQFINDATDFPDFNTASQSFRDDEPLQNLEGGRMQKEFYENVQYREV
jgi:hypothetical protein